MRLVEGDRQPDEFDNALIGSREGRDILGQVREDVHARGVVIADLQHRDRFLARF